MSLPRYPWDLECEARAVRSNSDEQVRRASSGSPQDDLQDRRRANSDEKRTRSTSGSNERPKIVSRMGKRRAFCKCERFTCLLLIMIGVGAMTFNLGTFAQPSTVGLSTSRFVEGINVESDSVHLGSLPAVVRVAVDSMRGASDLHGSDNRDETPPPNLPTHAPIHVFMCTDERDLRPVAAAINSTLVNSVYRHVITFHLIVPPSMEANANAKLGLIFPEADIQVDSRSLDVAALEGRIAYFATSGARQELKSPYNFASFYLAEKYRDLRRLIYFDTDVIVQGDVAELGHMGLDGNPIATVEDCSQNFELYFDFKQLERMGWTSMWPYYNKGACVFNHGMFVMDTEKWIAANVTVHIEKWMSRFRDSKGTLYKFGLSQPPWLLALYRRYKKLGYEWNLRGLGRNEFVANEKANLASLGFDAEWFRKHGLQGGNRPYVAPHSEDAKLLHFNGRYKPWKASRHNVEKTTALCGTELKPCSKIWWSYISSEAENILKPEKLGTADAL